MLFYGHIKSASLEMVPLVNSCKWPVIMVALHCKLALGLSRQYDLCVVMIINFQPILRNIFNIVYEANMNYSFEIYISMF